MVSKPFVCENNEAARGIKVEELPGNFGHPWATQNGVSLCLYGTPNTLQGCKFFSLNCFVSLDVRELVS